MNSGRDSAAETRRRYESLAVNYYESEAMFLLDLTAAQQAAEVVVTLNPTTPSETVVTGERCRVQLVTTRPQACETSSTLGLPAMAERSVSGFVLGASVVVGA